MPVATRSGTTPAKAGAAAAAAAAARQDGGGGGSVLVTVGTTKFEALIRCAPVAYVVVALVAHAVGAHGERLENCGRRSSKRAPVLFINSQTNLSTPLHTHSTQNAAANSAVDTHAFADALAAKGYARLVIQKGAGAYRPRVLVPPGAARAVLPSGLEVE